MVPTAIRNLLAALGLVLFFSAECQQERIWAGEPGGQEVSVTLKDETILTGVITEEYADQIVLKVYGRIPLVVSRTEILSISREITDSESRGSADRDLLDLEEGLRHAAATPTPISWEKVELDIGRKGFSSIKHLFENPVATPSNGSIEGSAHTPEVEPDTQIGIVGEQVGLVISTEGTGSIVPAPSAPQGRRDLNFGVKVYSGDTVNIHSGRSELLLTQSGGSRLGLSTRTHITLLDGGVKHQNGRLWLQTTLTQKFRLVLNRTVLLPDRAVLVVDRLRSGFRIGLIEGALGFFQDGQRTTVAAPHTVLVGTGRTISTLVGTDPLLSKAWQEWQRAFPSLTVLEEHALTLDRLETLAHALKAFHRDTGSFPSPAQGGLKQLLSATGEANWRGPYLPSTETPRQDAWGQSIRYDLPSSGEGDVCLLRSLGPNHIDDGVGGDDIIRAVEPTRK